MSVVFMLYCFQVSLLVILEKEKRVCCKCFEHCTNVFITFDAVLLKYVKSNKEYLMEVYFHENTFSPENFQNIF